MSNQINELTDINILLDSNVKYTPQGSVQLALQNMPDSVVYRSEGVVSKTSDSLTFDMDVSEHFCDRSVYVNWSSLPVFFKFATPEVIIGSTMTDRNCIEQLDGKVCYREGGLINAISSINTTIDGQNFNSNSVDKLYKVVSNYYDPETLNYCIDSSLPDQNTNYLLNSDQADWIPTLSTDNKHIFIKNSKLNSSNPFDSCVDPKYNSRSLVISDASLVTEGLNYTGINCNLKNLSLWLPFNIFTTFNDETPIYNANKIKVILQLHSNWINKIFSMKPNVTPLAPEGGGTKFKNVFSSPFSVSLRLNDMAVNGSGDISMFFRLYKPPNGIVQKLDYLKPYIRNYPLVELDSRTQDIVFKANEFRKTVTSSSFDCRSIPQKIYLAFTPKLTTDDDFRIETNHFARVDNLSIELHGVTTDIASGNGSESIYQMSRQNGLNINKNSSLYIRGAPICIEVSNDIAGKNNSLIGVNNNSSGKFTTRFKCEITRLHTDRALFKMTNFATAGSDEAYSEKVYEMNVIFVYSTYFVYNMFGKKFSLLESLSMDQLALLDKNVNDLYINFIPRMNIIGGSVFSVIGEAAKSVGKGLYNIVKDVISNKNNIRDNLLKSYKGGSIVEHSPFMGGSYSQSKIIGGKSLLDYE